MSESSIEVIIPVKDRAEMSRCVRSLLPLTPVQQIWLCDGGSSQPDCLAALQELAQLPQVTVLHRPIARFNKSHLLNQGILQTRADYVLLSDADIVWNLAALEAVLAPVMAHPNTLCYVQQVQESDGAAVALQRDRYTYQITQHADLIWVKILPVDRRSAVRPGCGLVCARRATLLQLGGYHERFQGWGWEDQDLLMRAQLLGMQIQAAGQVLHLSHGDAQRNQHQDDFCPSQTRNQNILTCLNQLRGGRLQGDLAPIVALPRLPPQSLRIQLPDKLLPTAVRSPSQVDPA